MDFFFSPPHCQHDYRGGEGERRRGSGAGSGGRVSLWRGVKPTIPAPRALTIDKAFVRDVLCIDARPLNLESCI